MAKFLSIPDVKSVLAIEQADAFLQEAREMAKPVDHGDKTTVALFNELKTKYMLNHEATGMSVKQYHDSLLSDQRARHLLWENMDRFMKLEQAGRYFMEGNTPAFTMRETLEGFVTDNDPRMSSAECLKVIQRAGHMPLLAACADILFTS